MAQEASWRAGGRTKPGKNKSHHNTPRRHQQHIKKIKNAVKHLKDRPVEGGFLMVRMPDVEISDDFLRADFPISSNLLFKRYKPASPRYEKAFPRKGE
jgi:hypothetical protein